MAERRGELMSPEDFERFFNRVLTDRDFVGELLVDGFGALERNGFDIGLVSPDTRTNLARLAGRDFLLAPEADQAKAVSRCGTCGVCGLCTLCGEINLGSGSAALWATFFLA